MPQLFANSKKMAKQQQKPLKNETETLINKNKMCNKNKRAVKGLKQKLW